MDSEEKEKMDITVSYLSFQDLSQHNCAKAIRLGSDEKVLTK